MGKPKTQERLQGGDLFINSDLSLKQVAQIIKVSPAKVGQWANEDEWELQRTSRQATAEKIISNYYTMIAQKQKEALDANRTLTPAEVDALHKMADSIEKLKKKMNIGTYYNVLSEFAKSIATSHLDAAKLLAPLMMEFMKDKVKQLQDAS
jgi:sugar diacid utilization regulator